MKIDPVLSSLEGKLVVSCQGATSDAHHDPATMASYARYAIDGGAAGIRANGPEDISAIRRAVAAPILGIQKALHHDGRMLITPSFEAAQALAAAGASAIALDCTARGRTSGALERLARIRAELRLPVLADVATVEEGLAAAEAGADMLLSTMRGYTPETGHVNRFEPEFVAALVDAVSIPVAAEGHIWTPEEAATAIAAGAFCVVVGTAITRPSVLARRFCDAIEAARGAARAFYMGIDLGSTNTKSGIVTSRGELLYVQTVATPAGGRDILLRHLERVAQDLTDTTRSLGIVPSGLGVATGGWVDTETGRVLYASENLPGWTGTPVGPLLKERLHLPVVVENDANALAVAEKRFGFGRDLSQFVSITLGTGVGGGCYIHGRLNRGANCFANAVGHIPIQADGLPCTCGARGCLEAYANAAALRRYDGNRFASAAEVIEAAKAGDVQSREAVRTLAGYLAAGCAAVVNLLDPQALILGGGLVEENELLLSDLRQALTAKLTASSQRNLTIRASSLGYHGGVLGAAAIVMDAHSSRHR